MTTRSDTATREAFEAWAMPREYYLAEQGEGYASEFTDAAWQAWQAATAAATQRAERDRKDAERYRWLRDHLWSQALTKVVVLPIVWAVDYPGEEGKSLDAAIDAALRENERSE